MGLNTIASVLEKKGHDHVNKFLDGELIGDAGVVVPLLWNTKNVAVHLLTLGRYGERVTLSTPGAQTLPYGVAIAIGGLAAWFLPLPGGAL